MSRPIYKYAVLLPQSKGYDDSEWRVFRESIKGELKLADKEIRGDPSKQLILQRNILTEDPKAVLLSSCFPRTTRRNLPGKELAFCIIAGDVWSEKVYAEYFSKAECPIFVVTGLRISNSSQKLFQWSPSAWTVFFCLTKLACKHVKSELAKRSIEDEYVYFHVYYRNDAKGAVVSEICKRTIGEEYKERHGIYNCSIEELMAQDKKLLHEHFLAKGDHRVIIYGFGSEYSNLLDFIGVLKKNGMVINVYGDINALPEIEDDQRIRTDYLVSTFVEEHVRTSPQYMALYYSELIRFCAKVLDKSLSGRNKESLEKKYEGKVGCFFRDKLTEVRFHYSDKYGSIYFANDGGFCAPLYLLSKGKQRSVLPEIQTFSESSTDELAQQLSKIDGYIQEFSPVSMDLNLKISECDSDNTIGTQSLKKMLSKLHAEIFSSYFGATETLFISRLPNTVRDFFSTGIVIKGKEIVDPILEFLDVNGIANSVQINLREQDIEDNGVLRLYVKYGKKKNAIKPYYYWDEGSENADSVVFAHTIELAKSSTKWESVESGNSWSLLLRSIKDLRNKGNSYIYLIPESNVSKKCSFVMLCTSRKLSLFDIQMGQNLVARIFSKIQIAIRENGLMLANTKSAIGSIMSRNGSHNIGSHVLAALSHNVGTMPDDRVLYQYIQHRMDYIATATTEFLTWRQPTMLVSDMMREFLSQTHLLNYISRSEGLRAYQFQNPSIGKQDKQFQTIKFHIRKIHDDCNDWESNSFVGENDKNLVDSFIVYGGTDSATFDKDIAVAIPGGVVGQHAFFTILENIIRNAAKHEWSKLTKKDKCNLDVYVDFHDNRNEGIVEMRVWTDCSVQQKDIGETINSLAKKINQRFISPDSGELVRENLGLAEMRISAGFLMGSGIEQIGGIREEKGGPCELVRPISIKHKEGKEFFGYRFNFMKPKELLVIISDLKDDDVKSINDVLSQFGIELMSKKKSKEALKGLSYSYVLIDHLDSKEDASLLSRLPFRILSPNTVNNPQNTDLNIIANYFGDFYSVEGKETIGKKLGRIQKEFKLPNKIKEFAHHLLEEVYASWVVHIRTERNIPLYSKLWVDVDGDGKGAGKSLVTDSDLLHFVFEHSFNSAVRGYLQTVDKKQVRPELAGALYSFVMLDSREIKTVEDLSGLKNINGRELDVVGKIALQLIQFAETCLDNLPNSGERAKVKIDVEKIKADDNTYVHENWKQSLQGVNLLESLLYIYEGCKRIYIEEDVDNAAKFSDVRAFVKYLRDVVLEQARAFLSKYEERIATIPETFVSAKVLANRDDSNEDNRNDVPVYEWKLRDKTILSAVFSSKRLVLMERGFHKDGFCYWRHGDEYGKGNEDSLGVVKYFEPLSGSQSYLNSLVLLQRNVRCLQRDASDNRLSAIRDMTGLVECALMRILIIDERASKFEKEHPEVAWIFKKACITVWDDTADQIRTNASSELEFKVFKDFDIVIIHQGIIDKILPNDHSKQSVENFLQELKEHSRYVVITTGRGMPSNVPATARVLPFSVVENTMFTRYPEKMLLVDTIMNILPREK